MRAKSCNHMIQRAFQHVLIFLSHCSSNSNEAISNYVQRVFVMAPGILSLVGFLLVLFFKSSLLPCKFKGGCCDVYFKICSNLRPDQPRANTIKYLHEMKL